MSCATLATGVAGALLGWFLWRAWADYQRLVRRRDQVEHQWNEDDL